MVFDQGNKKHQEFRPVMKWISQGKGKMIYGGQKYGTELKKAKFILPIMTELQRGGRLVHLDDSKVDTIARDVKMSVKDAAFNDEHIVAMVIVSRCAVVCTDDRLATEVLKHRSIYVQHKLRPPKIYRYLRHKNMCCDHNLAAICQK
jgi:hypothetical protein